MPFSHKLNHLMEIFGVSNNRLAKALSIDASLVSRWRTGNRVPAQDSPYIKKNRLILFRAGKAGFSEDCSLGNYGPATG
ncbi:hypothetical protein BR63_04535 [Thermanaerosceptrum fracticalcis]|uniref:Uncharacterized protein n=1 Tax=Thermanaerosceptrum fracticalcis TaxID=1712410 RepID=A0A7G6E0N5_THEFR|nr:hypothetical protein [Thermanaerosceptrum fracticalcis]QNB45639.1 hypothetical protein BR63_04535 [Thermanaerosceptrum fracticalcis]